MAGESEVRARWVGGRQFVGIDEGGQAIVIDASVEGGGQGEGFRPANLLLAALAGCTGYDVVNILEKQRQRLSALEVRVRGIQQPDPPWTFTDIHVEYLLRGQELDPQRVERAIKLSEESYCSVAATIGGRARLTTSFRIEEG
jgi:putative redox protein